MPRNDSQVPNDETQANELLRREAARKASLSKLQTSPPAVEATLASISAEVMEEALERLHRRAKPE